MMQAGYLESQNQDIQLQPQRICIKTSIPRIYRSAKTLFISYSFPSHLIVPLALKAISSTFSVYLFIFKPKKQKFTM